MLIVDVASTPPVELPRPPGVIVAVGDPVAWPDEVLLEQATFTLTETETDDRRVITVPSVSEALAELELRCRKRPIASSLCDDVLRAIDPEGPAMPGVITESLAYSTLQSGPEFASWLAERGAVSVSESAAPPLAAGRDGTTLKITFNQPARHNAFSTDMRALLLEALTVGLVDDAVTEVVLTGAGPSFCSGGDLAEFGTFTDPAAAHLARTRHSPALALDALTRRLGRNCRADVHGSVLGSGLEMAAFCGWVRCREDAVLGLPELALGLIPGAGGTVSVTRRIGRWRTAYLILSGRTIDARTALAWNLVDEIQ